jgi:hypothetical protein
VLNQLSTMSVAQLQTELSKLTWQEKLVLANYLTEQAESSSELSPGQLAELDRRYADAVTHPEKLISPEEAERRLRR